VRVPDRYRVGEIGGGWNVLAYALEIEHGAAGGSAGHGSHHRELAERASRWARTATRDGVPVLADPRARERLARVQMHADMSLVLDRRALWFGVMGRPDRGEGPMSKIFGTDVCQQDAADLLDLWAPDSLIRKGADGAIAEGDPEFAYRVAAATRVYAGTSEIMKSIIAQLALGLPRSRS
jgi:alkylation response protein AidB-like acyl-CoA dehydrogenase